MDQASRLLMALLAEEFLRSDVTRAEHNLYAGDFAALIWQGNIRLPPAGTGVRVTFELVDEGLLCDGGGA